MPNDFKVYIPSNEFKIRQGYYSRNRFVALMRKYKNNPEIVQFLADMLEG